MNGKSSVYEWKEFCVCMERVLCMNGKSSVYEWKELCVYGKRRMKRDVYIEGFRGLHGVGAGVARSNTQLKRFMYKCRESYVCGTERDHPKET